MQIDRARFLLLTASLAGGGCSSNHPADPAMPPTPAETGAETEPTPAGPSRAGNCDNDKGTVPACSISAPPGPHCESLSDTQAACKSYKSGLRGAIAAKAVACLNAASRKPEVCDWQTSEDCAMRAIRTACILPSTFKQCSALVSQCSGNLTMQDCQRLLSSVKDGKRKAMITCMTEGCSTDSCMWSLR